MIRARWYVCGGSPDAGCGRWFGIDYRDPFTGETLQDHDHNGTQLALDLFPAPVGSVSQ